MRPSLLSCYLERVPFSADEISMADRGELTLLAGGEVAIVTLQSTRAADTGAPLDRRGSVGLLFFQSPHSHDRVFAIETDPAGTMIARACGLRVLSGYIPFFCVLSCPRSGSATLEFRNTETRDGIQARTSTVHVHTVCMPQRVATVEPYAPLSKFC